MIQQVPSALRHLGYEQRNSSAAQICLCLNGRVVKPNQTDLQGDRGRGPRPVPDITPSLISNQQLSHFLCRLQNPPYCSPTSAPYSNAGHHFVQVEMDIQGEVTPSSAQCLSGAGQGGTAHGQTLHHHLPHISCSLRLQARLPKAAAGAHTEGLSPCSPRQERCFDHTTREVQTLQLLISTSGSGETLQVSRLCKQTPTSSRSDAAQAQGPLAACVWSWNSWPSAQLDSQHLLLMSPFCSNIFPLLIQPISNNKQLAMCLSQVVRASQRMRQAVYLYCWQAALIPSRPQEQLLWKIKAIEMNHDSLYPGTAASPQSIMCLFWICCSKTTTFPDVKTSSPEMEIIIPHI